MKLCEELVVPARAARALTVKAGQTLRIVDVRGGQPGDLVAFSTDDLAVRMSPTRTRVENGKVFATKGDRLWTGSQPPATMLTVTVDTFGAHDLLFPPCCRYALEKRFGVARDGCLEHLTQALAPWGIGVEAMPDPLNLFFRVTVDESGGMRALPPASTPGSTIAFRAAMDCLVAIATCAVPFAGRDPSEYLVSVTSQSYS